ncbi:MAG: hypothetical protein AcusKO_05200 [Acuticoccus sp.]
MSISDVTIGRTKAAWLLDFRIDSSVLKNEHKAWLDRTIVRPLLAEHAANEASGKTSSDGHCYTIWVIGSASRTGSYDYNLRLSNRRAEVVRRYLAEKLTDATVVVSIRTHALSELRAAYMGDKDETENMAHRAVYVAFTRHDPKLPPAQPPITPPNQVIAVDFFFYAERAAWFNVQKWKGELYARYKHKGKFHHVGWFASASGLTIGPGDINKGFTPSLPSNDLIFAGPSADFTFPSPVLLERLNGKAIYPRIVGKTMTLRVVDGAPDRGDLNIKMGVRHGSLELSQAVGSLHRMKTMNPEAVKVLYRAIRATSNCPNCA